MQGETAMISLPKDLSFLHALEESPVLDFLIKASILIKIACYSYLIGLLKADILMLAFYGLASNFQMRDL